VRVVTFSRGTSGIAFSFVDSLAGGKIVGADSTPGSTAGGATLGSGRLDSCSHLLTRIRLPNSAQNESVVRIIGKDFRQEWGASALAGYRDG
jgi:hypothetical protein